MEEIFTAPRALLLKLQAAQDRICGKLRTPEPIIKAGLFPNTPLCGGALAMDVAEPVHVFAGGAGPGEISLEAVIH